MLADYAERDGILADWTWIEGETRVSVIILAPETGEITVLNEEGPTVTLHDWERLQTSILALAAKTHAVCLSGTLPLGLPSEVISTLIKALNRDKRRVFVDSSGAPLKAAVSASPEVIKINSTEAAILLGWHEFDDSDTAAKAAKAIQHNGISTVIITLGAKGAVLASDSGLWLATPPPLTIVNPIGSGDSFLAGLTLSLLQDMPPQEALRRAVAAGSANALSAAGGNFSVQDYDRILAEVTVTKR
jgi:1-phosphofructokinase family hexose kinase